jgi:hypothetical protein
MNKKMKNNQILKRIALVSVSALTLTFACKDQFLEVPPTASLAQAQLSSKAGVEGALIGTYAQLAAIHVLLQVITGYGVQSAVERTIRVLTQVTTRISTPCNVMKYKLLTVT